MSDEQGWFFCFFCNQRWVSAVDCAVVDQLVRSSAVDVILVDSVAALVPRAEIEGEIGMIQVIGQPQQQLPPLVLLLLLPLLLIVLSIL